MRTNESNVDRGIAVSNTDIAEYPAPALHRIEMQGQLDDNNDLFDTVSQSLERLDRQRGVTADKDTPHRISRQSFSWTSSQPVEVGLFASNSQCGYLTGAGYNSSQKLHIGCYSSIESGRKTTHPVRVSVVLERRSSELVYPDGNAFTWAKGWDGSTHIAGTRLRIVSTYAANPELIWRRAFELLGALVDSHQLAELYAKTEYTTLRVGGVETYHRHHNKTLLGVSDTIHQTAGLLVWSEEDCKEHLSLERGERLLHRLQSPHFGLLGFDMTIQFEHKGARYTDDISDAVVKVYEHLEASRLPSGHSLTHPKSEVKIHGWYPAPAFETVVRRATTILHAYLAWGGVEASDLVTDDHYTPDDHELVTTPLPTEYLTRLDRYYRSDQIRDTAIGHLFHRQTMAPHDIIATLLFRSSSSRYGSSSLPYDALVEHTGLAKETVRRHVRKLEELNLVKRVRSHKMYVALCKESRNVLRELVLPAKRTVGKVMDEVRNRALARHERRDASNEDDDDESSNLEVVTPAERRDAEEHWVSISRMDYLPEDLPELVRDGVISRDDIYLRK